MIQALYSYWPWMLLLGYLQLRIQLGKGQKREAIVSTGLMLIALVYGTLAIAIPNLPSPVEPMRMLFEQWGMKLLHQS